MPALAALARQNAAANGLAERVEVIEGDVRDLDARPAAAALRSRLRQPALLARRHRPARGGAAARRRMRRRAWRTGPASWRRRSARRGSLSLILPAARLDAAMAALAAAGCGGTRLLPFWPRAGLAAKRVLLQARRGGPRAGADRARAGAA